MSIYSRAHKLQPFSGKASKSSCSVSACQHHPGAQAVRKFPSATTRCPASNLAPNRFRKCHVSAYGGVAYPSAQTAVTASYEQDPCIWRNDYHQHYIHGKLLGSGSFGNVHLAIHRQSGVEVAVKVMPKHRAHLTQEKTIEKITKEVGIMDALQGCSNVVRLYGCFENEFDVQLVMEYCSGGDLQQALEVGGALSEAELCIVAYEVLKIIKACHDRSILHGDVKPANFIFSRPRHLSTALPYGGDCLKAIDFGCSQYLPCGERLPRRVGTPAYMAPEVFQRNAGVEADMWSLGVMLFQLYTGRFPFWAGRIPPGATGVEEVKQAVLHRPVLIQGTTFPHLSTDGKDFLLKCLQRDLDARLTVDEALQHSWLCKMLCHSNIVPTGSYFAAQRGCTQHC